MANLQPSADPYRTLGVLRGATPAQVKAAHRRLAKRYHPDGATGDEQQFLAVQEAYQLLSDPLRRADWDRQHAPGPVRATSSRRRQTGTTATSGMPGTRPPRGTTRVRRARPAGGARSRTWTAEHVPWWQDFRPGKRQAPGSEAGSTAASTAASTKAATADAPNEFDVFNRSSGAAWSAAARRHFRQGTDDLPSRGVWRYRGTQVVTGAEARKVAAEEEEENSSR